MTSRTQPRHSLGHLFGNLKVRPKLIVLHNLFFLILTAAVFFAVPPAERRVVLIALGIVYVIAVLALELVILPLYVYRPIKMLLEADQASLECDRAREII